MKTISFNIDDEFLKAFEFAVATPIDMWISRAVHNRALIGAEKICEMAIEDKEGAVLSLENRQALKTYLANQGIDVLTSPKQLPERVKMEIVKRATVKTAAERESERPKP